MIVVDIFELRPEIIILQIEEFPDDWEAFLWVALKICFNVVADFLLEFMRNLRLVGQQFLRGRLPPRLVQGTHLDTLFQGV